MQYSAGVDLGGTSIKVGIVDEELNIVAKTRTATRAAEGPMAVCGDIWSLIEEAADQAGISTSDVKRIGIGCPGAVDAAAGIINFACNIDMIDVKFAELLTTLSGTPVFLENDANCAALGEVLKGAARGSKSAVALTLGTGIGGGLIIDGKIYGGFNFFGGEIGHMVIEVDGVSCACGRRGCFEQYASAAGLIRLTKEAMAENKSSLLWELCQGDLEQVDGTTAFEGQKRGDGTAKAVLKLFYKYLAAGVTNIINILQPEVMVIGGGLSGQGETLLAPLREIVYREVYSKHSKVQTKIVTSVLGNDAGIIGAAHLGAGDADGYNRCC